MPFSQTQKLHLGATLRNVLGDCHGSIPIITCQGNVKFPLAAPLTFSAEGLMQMAELCAWSMYRGSNSLRGFMLYRCVLFFCMEMHYGDILPYKQIGENICNTASNQRMPHNKEGPTQV